MNHSRYQHLYTPGRFWQKLRSRAQTTSRGVLEKALYLHYAAQSASTPKWAKRVMYGALGYFIFPLDAIPDFAPLAGYTDDLSIMAAALATVAFYITPDVKAQAHRKLNSWFGAPTANVYTDA